LAHALNGTYHKAITRQIEEEEVHPMLPTDIYPLLTGRALFCTSQAAQRMREIVQCMGTESEKRRAAILLGQDTFDNKSHVELRQLLTRESVHPVPDGIALPVEVVLVDLDDVLSTSKPGHDSRHGFSPSFASQITSMIRLTPVNSSVFFYGWKRQSTTITSNRAVAQQLNKAIDDLLDQMELTGDQGQDIVNEFCGPQLHICEVARSLIGKSRKQDS
jgi:hypothetical protein